MTIFGRHSVAELRDWLRSLDYEIGSIAKEHEAFASTWAAEDGSAAAEWAREWSALQARYGAAHAKAAGRLARAALEPVPDSVDVAEDEWQAVLRAVAATPGRVAKGDLQDLYARLAAAQGKAVDLSRMPQPTAGADADLQVFQAADTAVRAGEAAARQATPSSTTGGLVLLGAALGLAGLLALRTVIK